MAIWLHCSKVFLYASYTIFQDLVIGDNRKSILIMLLEKRTSNSGLGDFESKGESESIMDDFLS